MIVLISGASHTGKTLLAQKLMELVHIPYLSIDHLKMVLIRSHQCRLNALSEDDALTQYLWPIIREMIKTALLETVNVSFNRISVDGDTSTNDSCIVLANGLAGNPEITEKNGDYAAFLEARMMAKDGGARHLITCTVTGARDEAQAETVAKSVISSTLTKAAIFGADANWGRVLCAMGYSGAEFDPEKVDVTFASAAGEIAVCAQGRGLDFDEDKAKKILTEHDVEIRVTMGEGGASCTCWGFDITYDYIKINGDYRT